MQTGYNKLCDWWSLGVIMYEMLIGESHASCAPRTLRHRWYTELLGGKLGTWLTCFQSEVLWWAAPSKWHTPSQCTHGSLLACVACAGP